jgi:hypothetical protein
VPEQRLQAAVDAGQLRDRLRGGQAQRALAEAVEQRGGDLGVARRLGGEAAVEHGQGHGREHRPDGLHGQQPGAGRGLPRAYEVARAQQLRADVIGDHQLARKDAVEHQQADVVGAGPGQPLHVPRADREPVRPYDQLALGIGPAAAGQQRAELGIRLEQADRVGPSRHARRS